MKVLALIDRGLCILPPITYLTAIKSDLENKTKSKKIISLSLELVLIFFQLHA